MCMLFIAEIHPSLLIAREHTLHIMELRQLCASGIASQPVLLAQTCSWLHDLLRRVQDLTRPFHAVHGSWR